MNITTTENIVRQMTKKEEKALDPERLPILATTLKKGQQVDIYDDPTKKDALLHGRAELKKLNDAQVFHHLRGYENWRVRFLDTGEEADRIISHRHLIKDGSA
jgi:hypothetical protein